MLKQPQPQVHKLLPNITEKPDLKNLWTNQDSTPLPTDAQPVLEIQVTFTQKSPN